MPYNNNLKLQNIFQIILFIIRNAQNFIRNLKLNRILFKNEILYLFNNQITAIPHPDSFNFNKKQDGVLLYCGR